MTSADLLRPSVLKELCARAGIRPDRRSGQNFLINRATLERIVAAVDPQPGDTILEVGAGFGTLTLALAPRVARVIAIERDRRIVPILRELVGPCGNVEIVEGDVLALLSARTQGGKEARRQRELLCFLPFASLPSWKLAANLPYSITSDFLRLLFDAVGSGAFPPPERAILMLQREVVDRMTADPSRHSDRGAAGFLTILTQLHCTPRRIARVPPAHFWPAPKVESAVVALEGWRTPSEIAQLLSGGAPPPLPPEADRRSPPNGKGSNARDGFLRIVRAAFAHPRRQLIGNLRAATASPRTILEQQLHAVGIDPAARPETLTLTAWIALARSLR